MAISKRRKGLARWLVAGLSGLAAAGFLGAILGGPHPTDANPAVSAAGQPPAVTSNEPAAGAPAAPPAWSQPSGVPMQPSQAPVFSASPRFRTRGS